MATVHPSPADLAAAQLAGTPYGTLPPASPLANRKPISLPRLLEMHSRGEKITVMTAYDATFAAVADAAGVECILIGDSLGMVCQGLHSTVGVTLDDMRYHTQSVARGFTGPRERRGSLRIYLLEPTKNLKNKPCEAPRC